MPASSTSRIFLSTGTPRIGLHNVRVGLTGLEPVTSALSGQRSNRLSYRPAYCGVEPGRDYRTKCPTPKPVPDQAFPKRGSRLPAKRPAGADPSSGSLEAQEVPDQSSEARVTSSPPRRVAA